MIEYTLCYLVLNQCSDEVWISFLWTTPFYHFVVTLASIFLSSHDKFISTLFLSVTLSSQRYVSLHMYRGLSYGLIATLVSIVCLISVGTKWWCFLLCASANAMHTSPFSMFSYCWIIFLIWLNQDTRNDHNLFWR